MINAEDISIKSNKKLLIYTLLKKVVSIVKIMVNTIIGLLFGMEFNAIIINDANIRDSIIVISKSNATIMMQ